MKSLKVAVLLLVLMPVIAGAQKKTKKPNLPEVVGSARLVHVEAADGQEFDPNLDPAERLAIADLRDAIKAWGRYTITPERDKADLIFVVRKGQLARGNVSDGPVGPDRQGGPQGGQFPQQGGQFPQQGGQLPSQQGGPYPQARGQWPGQQGGGVTDPGMGGDTDLQSDQLQVCQLNANGKLSHPLWVHSMASGLNGPRILLFAQFKDDVEKVYPSPPAKP
jgi:hypothetical protein